MTLVVDQAGNGPQVHVLAIGVGGYRHLAGGREPVDHSTFNLKQLTSPPHSALAFVDWITRINHPSATLGTVELLVSPEFTYTQPDGAKTKVAEPSAGNVRAAFDRWKAHCDSDTGNVAVFYCCGHGVERESQFLLLEDFGKSNNRLLENTVDVGKLYVAMNRCKARTQYYFMDACRQILPKFYDMLSGNAPTLLDPWLRAESRKNAALLFATSGGGTAYGKRDKPTLFTQSLVRGLDGLGSRKDNSRWVVTMPDLMRAVTQLMGPKQPAEMSRCIGVSPLHILRCSPTVPVNIDCEPDAAVRQASLALTRVRKPGDSTPPPRVGPRGWSYQLPADIYNLTIAFPSGSYQQSETDLHAWPPGYNTAVVISQ